ncbi:MAG: carotenoid oxygenase family protein [Myxococcota bacterium]
MAQDITNNQRYQRIPLTPIDRESTHTALEVEGQIPPELDGMYVRNGPNQLGETPPNLHYFSGHGMVHGVRLAEGHAHWYRSRAVRAANVSMLLGQPDVGGPVNHGMDASPNTNVVMFGSTLYASMEAGPSLVELDSELASVRRSNLDGALPFGFTGHHKIDPDDGDVHGVVYSQSLRGDALYVRLSPDGRLLNQVRVPLSGATQIHDMSITKRFAVIYDLNVVFDARLASRTTLPITWAPDKPARIGLLPKAGTAADVRWFEVEPCYVYHPLNAYETESGDVVIDVSRYPKASERDHYGPLGDTLPTIDRWTLPLDGSTQRAKEERISALPLDFPMVSPLVQGRRYRFGYTVQATLEPSFKGAVKLDVVAGTVEHQSFDGGSASELTFVPRPGATSEDDGWLLGFAYDPGRDRSRLTILNAQDFSGEPAANIWIPDLRVPIGTHGGWFPGHGAR